MEIENTVGTPIQVRAMKLSSAFKGSIEVEGDKLKRMQQGFIRAGYIKIREQERLLFHTGIFITELPSGIKGAINTNPSTMMFKGLRVVGPELIIEGSGEILMLVHNDSLHLSEISIGESLGILTFSSVSDLKVNLEYREV